MFSIKSTGGLGLASSLFVASIPVLIMWGGVYGGFIFDDYGNIVFNQKVHLQHWDVPSIRNALLAYGGPIARPLPTLSFAFNYWLDGKSPVGYKVLNLSLHAMNSVLVLYFLRILLAQAWRGASHRSLHIAATVAALAWAAHPIQVSSVLYVVQRMEVMAAGFVFAAMICYLRGRTLMMSGECGWGLIAGSALFALLGLMCKESAILTPLYTLGLELCFFRFSAARRQDRRLLVSLYVLAAAFATLGAMLAFSGAEASYASRNFSMSERLLTQLRVLSMYLGQIFWPSPSSLVFYYDWIEPSSSLFSPLATLWGAVLLIVIGLSGVVLCRVRPLYAFGIFLFFSAHVLTSSFIALDLAFEHRNYIALLGIIIVVCDLLYLASARIPVSTLTAFIAAVLILLTGATTLRALTWANPVVLANNFAKEAPDSPRAAYTLGVLMIQSSNGDSGSIAYGLGMMHLMRASKMKAASPLPLQAMIIVSARTGQEVPDAWWDALIQKFRERGFGAQEQSAYGTLISERIGGLHLSDARLQELSELVVRRRPGLRDLHFNYADFALVGLKDRGLALREYRKAIALTSPVQRSDFKQQLMVNLVNKGEPDLAMALAK